MFQKLKNINKNILRIMYIERDNKIKLRNKKISGKEKIRKMAKTLITL